MITVPMIALGIATACLLVGGFIWTVQARVKNEIALGQEFVAKKRAMSPTVPTDDELRQEMLWMCRGRTCLTIYFS